MLTLLSYWMNVTRRWMKIVANRNLRGMSLDSESGASYNRHYICARLREASPCNSGEVRSCL
ncbi:hypothetical protein D6I00_13425 [Salmonella enterica]|nr:hypothetical protein [Salmonella enterica]